MTNHQPNSSAADVVVLDRDAPRPSGGGRHSAETRGLSTARAVLKVLSIMAQHPEGVTAREIAGELGKSVSTAYDLLASLYEEGFTCREPGRGYRLRAEAALGTPAPEPSYLRALSTAADELFARTHRRSYLGRVENGAIVITAVCGRQGIPTVPGLGPRIRRSAHALAIGKVVLSLLPERGRRRYIERGLRTYSAHTITSPAALMSELARVREHGFALSRGEFDAECCCVAAPILDADGRFLAVLGLSTSSRAFEAEAPDLVGAVREVVAAVSGCPPQRGPTDGIRTSHVPSAPSRPTTYIQAEPRGTP